MRFGFITIYDMRFVYRTLTVSGWMATGISVQLNTELYQLKTECPNETKSQKTVWIKQSEHDSITIKEWNRRNGEKTVHKHIHWNIYTLREKRCSIYSFGMYINVYHKTFCVHHRFLFVHLNFTVSWENHFIAISSIFVHSFQHCMILWHDSTQNV